MKIRKQMQMQILAGLAGLALICSPVRARGIEDDGARQAAGQQSLAANGDYSGDAITPGMTAVGPTTPAEAELGRVMMTDTILLAIVLAGTVVIIAYTSVATRRRRELRPALSGRMNSISYGPAAGAASR